VEKIEETCCTFPEDVSWQILLKSAYVSQNYKKTVTFLPRDAMRKRGLCCRLVCVCPSVRPSVTLVYCIHRLRILSNFFLGPVAPSF